MPDEPVQKVENDLAPTAEIAKEFAAYPQP
jgi:hypothetical protein